MKKNVDAMDNNFVNDIAKVREMYRVACEYIDEGDLDSAEEKLIEVISLTPNLAEPYTNLGVLLCRDGEFE